MASTSSTIVTRFAPSPTGRLHLGHAYSAHFAYELARKNNGRFILRIEDIDQGRSRAEYIDGIYDDLKWLGLTWEQPVRIQSHHMDDYQRALDQLHTHNLLYPCFCTRKDIQMEIKRAGGAPHGPEGTLYPGTCKHLTARNIQSLHQENTPYALRLNLEKALEYIGNTPLIWHDEDKGDVIADPSILGDVVLARKDFPTSYHLSVCIDDALQGVTHVTRGEDLLYATHLHRLLQACLGLPVPIYHHHPLITDEDGKRFAKRNKSVTLESYRKKGVSGAEILQKFAKLPT